VKFVFIAKHRGFGRRNGCARRSGSRAAVEHIDSDGGRLPQSETQALDDRIFEPYGVRETGRISLSGCQPNRVQATTPPWIRMLGLRCFKSYRIGLCKIPPEIV
jgi:hypothetical protein